MVCRAVVAGFEFVGRTLGSQAAQSSQLASTNEPSSPTSPYQLLCPAAQSVGWCRRNTLVSLVIPPPVPPPPACCRLHLACSWFRGPRIRAEGARGLCEHPSPRSTIHSPGLRQLTSPIALMTGHSVRPANPAQHKQRSPHASVTTWPSAPGVLYTRYLAALCRRECRSHICTE